MVKLQVIGHLGKDGVVNNVNGKSVINFTVAHSEKFRDQQGVQKDKTLWVDCAYWTDRTAIAPYLKKGTQVYAEGTPDIRTYTTADGRQGATLSLRVSTVQLLGGRGDGEQSGGNAPSQQSQNAQPAYKEQGSGNSAPANDITEPLDDLPF
jgi:single-strand DNA-binding protein